LAAHASMRPIVLPVREMAGCGVNPAQRESRRGGMVQGQKVTGQAGQTRSKEYLKEQNLIFLLTFQLARGAHPYFSQYFSPKLHLSHKVFSTSSPKSQRTLFFLKFHQNGSKSQQRERCGFFKPWKQKVKGTQESSMKDASMP
ncbi:hypothetical protein HAX54_001687, partial [Datura stramonium]|nr:hypothetical protein [Datura stramonium]